MKARFIFQQSLYWEMFSHGVIVDKEKISFILCSSWEYLELSDEVNNMDNQTRQQVSPSIQLWASCRHEASSMTAATTRRNVVIQRESTFLWISFNDGGHVWFIWFNFLIAFWLDKSLDCNKKLRRRERQNISSWKCKRWATIVLWERMLIEQWLM